MTTEPGTGAALEAESSKRAAESVKDDLDGGQKRAKLDDDTTGKQRHQQNKSAVRTNRLGEKHKDGRRAGGGNRGHQERAGSDEEGEDSGPRLPKRKVAISFGYCGIGYSGLQINHDVKTIEGDIFDAFCQVGAISKDNAVNPNKVGLQRAARTDRGVHAAGNLLTMKLILEPPGVSAGQLVESVNKILPDLIRIWGFTRVQNSFNARTSCDSRQYEYLLPTYVFLPPKPGSHMYQTMKQWLVSSEGKEAASTSAAEVEEGNVEGYRADVEYLLNHPFWVNHGSTKTFQEDTAAKKKWRISTPQLNRVRTILAKYEGSHNFHNFTVGKPFRDRSAHRHMIKLTISDPKLINDCEWISIKFHGQSFMLHQIRKMIGLLVMVGRTSAPASLIPETFGPARIHVPKAPGLGLLLEEPIFAGYNRRLLDTMKRQGENPVSGNTGEGGVLKEPVVFSRFASEMEAFKQRWIYDRIHQEEEEKHEYVKFLQYLDVLTGTDFDYLNPKGVIPQSAILKVGEHVRPQVSKRSKEDDGQVDGGNGDGEDMHKSDDEEDEELLRGNQAELEG
jgi:tRNA pseudouridine38-40 synthase